MRSVWTSWLLTLVAVSSAVVATTPSAAGSEPPPNDDFAHATVISGLPFDGSHAAVGATVELGEPRPTCATELGGTAWYRLTPDRHQDLFVSALGGDVATTVGIYTGADITHLTEAGCLSGNGISRRDAAQHVAFDAGVTYHLQVFGAPVPATAGDQVIPLQLGHGTELVAEALDAATGDVLSGICVEAYPADRPTGAVYGHEFATGSDGSSVQVVPAGRLVVRFVDCDAQSVPPEPPSYAATWYGGAYSRAGATVVEVGDAPRIEITAELSVGGVISGTVTTDDTGDVGSYCVEAWHEGELVSTSYPDGPGYVLPGLPPGANVVRFDDCHEPRYLAEWFDDATNRDGATPVEVALDAETSGIDAELTRGGIIAGTLISGDDGGRPCVAAHTPDGAEVASVCGPVGDYELGPLPTGTFHVRFGGDGYLDEWYDAAADLAASTPVEAVAGATTAGVDADLYRLSWRLEGPDRVATAIEVSQRAFPDGAPGVVLARADDYADALAGAPLAALAKGPLLLTPGDGLRDDVAEELRRLDPRKVFLLGGPAALSAEVEDEVASETPLVRRIAGEDRFATAAAVRERLSWDEDSRATEVLIVEGANADPGRGWPDAVAVAWLGASELRPVLLVRHGDVPAATAEELTRRPLDSITIVGGPAAVSTEVEQQLRAIQPATQRVAGANRFATSTAVAESAVDAGADASRVWVVTGFDWPDALAAGPAVARDRGVLVFVDGITPLRANAGLSWTAARDLVRSLVVVGGIRAVSTSVQQELFDRAAVPCHPDGCASGS